jgi:homoserine kinase
MPRVSVTVPAACTNLGPGIDSLGLALGLHNRIEMSLRADSQQMISIGNNGDTEDHPVVKAALALVKEQKITSGFNLTCTGAIPDSVGLGETAAWTVGGLAAANNLLDAPLPRQRLIELAADLAGTPATVVTCFLGSLTITGGSGADLLYRRVNVPALQVVLAVPEVPDYRAAVPKKVDLDDVVFNMSRAALVVDALCRNDIQLLGRAMEDRILLPLRSKMIPGYDEVVGAAKRAGAAAVTISGDGPALVAFASANYRAIELAIQNAFMAHNIKVCTWTLNVDTQGIAISRAQ